MGEEIKLNHNIYSKYIAHIYRNWKAHEGLWNGTNALSLSLGRIEDDETASKTRAIQTYLFQYEMSDTIIFLTKTNVFILSGKRKCGLINTMLEASNNSDLTISVPTEVYQINPREDQQTSDVITEIFKKLVANGTVVLGIIESEAPYGLPAWYRALSKIPNINIVDTSLAWSNLLVIKDEQEIRNITTAASVTTAFLSKVRSQMEKIIDDGSNITHSDFIKNEVQKFLDDPSLINKKLTLDSPIEASFAPTIQSGKSCNLDKPQSPETIIHFGTIIIDVGTRFRSYSSEIARTYLVDACDYIMEIYEFLLRLEIKLINSMIPGTKFNKIYELAIKIIKKKYPDLVSNFSSSCGWSTGVQVQDMTYSFVANNENVLETNMVVVVRLGFANVPNPNSDPNDPETKFFSVLLADTVHITSDGAQILTNKAPKSKSEISYSIKEEEEEQALEYQDYEEDYHIRTRRSTRTANTDNHEELRKLEEHQKKLAQLQQEEMIRKYSAGNKPVVAAQPQKIKQFVSYPTGKDFPIGLKKNRIFVDMEAESIFLPIFGQSIPFHIRTVKNISKTEDFLKISFCNPGTVQQNEIFKNPDATFVKELLFKITDQNHLNERTRLINELRKRVQDRESEKKAVESLVAQEPLQKALRPGPRLNNLSVRPGLGAGSSNKTVGTLEAHANGFHYTTARGGVIDVIYKNIRYAFFQPSENDAFTIIHFHLHHAIMIGKKKTFNVQYVSQVMDIGHDSSVRASWGDPDEIEQEQREKDRIYAENLKFKAFCEEVHNLYGVEFELPYRDLRFQGTFGREPVMLMPTTNCLISLLIMPFLVLPLDDVEVVFFERISFQTKYFDITFVLKDYEKQTIHLTEIPHESLDLIRKWLDSCDIKFYSVQVAINWKSLLETIRKDILGFWEDGGWASYDDDDEQSNEEQVEEEDDFSPSGSESDDYSVTSDNEFEEDDEPEYEDDESVEDWDEQEEKLRKEDMKKEIKETRRRSRNDDEIPASKKKKY